MKRITSKSFLGNTWLEIKTWELNRKKTNVTCGFKNGQILLGVTKLNNNTNNFEGVLLTCNEVEGLEDMLSSNYVDLPLIATNCSCSMYYDSLCPDRLKEEDDDEESRFKDYAYITSGYYTLIICSPHKLGIGRKNSGHVELTNSEVKQLKKNIKEIYAFCRKAELKFELKRKCINNSSIAVRVKWRRRLNRYLDSCAKRQSRLL
jgi:hypothetical protein